TTQGGDDILVGGDGADTLSGGAGSDTILFAGDAATSQGVTIDLLTGLGRGADAQGDTYTGIENVVGTAFDDTLTGDNTGNRLEGGAGNDLLSGLGGDDTLVSSGGDDRLSGGEGSDIFSITGITAGAQRRVTLENGGTDRKTDTIYLDADHTILSHTRRVGDTLEVVADGVTLVLRGWRRGAGTDAPAFRITTRNGFTYDMDAEGGLSVTGVDISHRPGVTQLDLSDQSQSLSEDRVRRDRITTELGNSVMVIPHSPADARVITGNDGADQLTGNLDDNVIYAGGSGDGVDVMTGSLGKDTYVIESSGRYRIHNLAGDGEMDQLVLKTAFNRLQAARQGDNLQLVSATSETLIVDVVDFFTNPAARHIAFLSSDGIQFEIVGDSLDVTMGTVVYKTITGLDLSGSVRNVALDLNQLSGFQAARYAVASVLGSRGAENAVITTDLNTQVVGGNAMDRITSGAGDDTIDTGLGNDLVHAGAGDDRIWGGQGDDRLVAGAGNDVLVGGQGADELDGGDGSDTLVFDGSRGGVTVDLAAGTGLGGDAQGDTYWNIENVMGTSGIDRLTGNAGDNYLVGNAGDDVLVGNAGDDVLAPGTGSDRVDGGGGSDTVSYDGLPGGVLVDLSQGSARLLDNGIATAAEQTLLNIENIQGSANNDILMGDGGNNHLLGSLGRDRVDGGGGEDTLDYSALEFDGEMGIFLDLNQWVVGSDPLSIGQLAAPEGYLGQFARNIENILGSSANDQILGSEAEERIDAGGGRDTINARGGDDTLYGRGTGAVLDGGDGEDTLDYSLAVSGVQVSLIRDREGSQDRILNVENLMGSLLDDVLEGDGAGNVLSGNLGLDEIYGRGGDDTFKALGDGDIFHGGDGDDVADYRALDSAAFVILGDAAMTTDERRQWESRSRRFDYLIHVETVYGSDFSDVIQGSSNQETLYGRRGNDWLGGSSQGQVLSHVPGWNADSVVAAATPVRDTLDGGQGVDVVSYAHAHAAVYANLEEGLAGGDRLVSIEGIEGSSYNDVLVGSRGDDIFYGGAGNDLIHGGQGADTLDFSRAGATDGVRVTTVDPGDYTFTTTGITGGARPGVELHIALPGTGVQAGDTLSLTINGVSISLVLSEANVQLEAVRDALIAAIQQNPVSVLGQVSVGAGSGDGDIRFDSLTPTAPTIQAESS
ncbi:MAG: hypothetical protein MI747_03060, partial [Desulfobacterales bacterium]|nr:hypothetical protein [Desulfobacterales bacterium]